MTRFFATAFITGGFVLSSITTTRAQSHPAKTVRDGYTLTVHSASHISNPRTIKNTL